MGALQLHTVSPSPQHTTSDSQTIFTGLQSWSASFNPIGWKRPSPAWIQCNLMTIIAYPWFMNTAIYCTQNQVYCTRVQTWLSGSKLRFVLLEIKPIIQGSLTAWCIIICGLQIHPSDWLAMQSSTLIPDRNMQQFYSHFSGITEGCSNHDRCPHFAFLPAEMPPFSVHILPVLPSSGRPSGAALSL